MHREQSSMTAGSVVRSPARALGMNRNPSAADPIQQTARRYAR
jgi:hypothetical protein